MRRRDVLKGMTGAAAGLGIRPSADQAIATRPAGGPSACTWPIWKLDRPRPALPNSYFWTWDHSTNWMLDDAGMLNFGCANRYMKKPETYVEDYRRLTALAAGLGVKGILIWGFLRESHGGIDFAKRVADEAAARNIAIMPGIGTNWYGGVYYEGDHKYNIETFTRRYPDARPLDEKGNRDEHGVCPTYPAFVEWLREGIQWLFEEFAIGGANLENGDYVVCHCPRCRERQAQWPKDEPAFWMHQYLGYEPALQAVQSQLKSKLVTWATYKGFVPGNTDQKNKGAYMECRRPVMFDRLPAEGVCQWTLTSMVRSTPLPLSTFLENGTPPEALANDTWGPEVKPPSPRSVGFLHQGSQWHGRSRYQHIVGTIKEGCLRAYRAGLEGVSIHGEVSTMHVPWALNYLAFSHFIHWPADSLRQFSRKTLGQVLGSENEGEAFAELLAAWDGRSLSEEQKKDLAQREKTLIGQVAAGKDLTRWRFWHWLHAMAQGVVEAQTASIF
jgi:hypothetical protein